MKIDSNTPSLGSLGKTRQQRPASPGAAPATANEKNPALSVASAVATEPAGAPVDSQRVAEIRQSIVEGRLQIHPERIADRLVEVAREQLAKNRSY